MNRRRVRTDVTFHRPVSVLGHVHRRGLVGRRLVLERELVIISQGVGRPDNQRAGVALVAVSMRESQADGVRKLERFAFRANP